MVYQRNRGGKRGKYAKNKKKYARELLKKILEALHEKSFSEVVHLVDECALSESELQEFVQGTVEENGRNIRVSMAADSKRAEAGKVERAGHFPEDIHGFI